MKAEDYFMYMDSDCLAYNTDSFLTIFPVLIGDAIDIQYSRNRRRDQYPILNNLAGQSAGQIDSILKQSSETRSILKELVTISIFDT